MEALQNPAAPYLRVKQFLKAQLAEGRWPPGALMPSEAELWLNVFDIDFDHT